MHFPLFRPGLLCSSIAFLSLVSCGPGSEGTTPSRSESQVTNADGSPIGVSVVPDVELFLGSTEAKPALLSEIKLQILRSLHSMESAFRERLPETGSIQWRELSVRQVELTEKNFVGDGTLGLVIGSGQASGSLKSLASRYRVALMFQAKEPREDGVEVFRYFMDTPLEVLDNLEIVGKGKVSLAPQNSLPPLLAEFLKGFLQQINASLEATGSYRHAKQLSEDLLQEDEAGVTPFMRSVTQEVLVPLCSQVRGNSEEAWNSCASAVAWETERNDD